MTNLFIDTHTHLYDSAFDEDIDAVISDAINSGVTRMLLPAIDSSTHDQMLALSAKYSKNCFPMIGLHPTSVNENPDYKSDLEIIAKYLRTGEKTFYGIGETGLDLYWDKHFLNEQIDALRCHIDLALEYDLPIVLHVRDAMEEIIDVMRDYRETPLRGVFHSFSGTHDQYEQLKKNRDFVFGIGGVVTYKKSQIAEVVVAMDINDIVLETDSPYLTPVPFRGKRNQSSYIQHIAEKIAELKNISLTEVAGITTCNAERIFRLPPP